MSVFIPDPNWIQDFPTEPETVEKLKEMAEPATDLAAALTPLGPARRHMRDQYVVVERDGAVYIGNTDPAFHLVEFGSINNETVAPLRRAIRAMGLRLAENPKS